MVAWADFEGNYSHHQDDLTVATRGLLQVAPVERSKRFDEILADILPHLASDVVELRKGLQGVNGWSIEWRQWNRGEGIAVDTVEQPGITSMRVVRGPAEYVLSDGVIISSEVGVSPITLSLAANLEIGWPGSRRGIFYNMAGMFEIDITPPGDSLDIQR